MLSCTEEDNILFTDPQFELFNNINLVEGALHFKDGQEFSQALDKIHLLTEEQLDKFESQTNFISRRTVKNHLEKSSSDEILFHHMDALVQEDGYLFVGNSRFKFYDNKQEIIAGKDWEDLFDKIQDPNNIPTIFQMEDHEETNEPKYELKSSCRTTRSNVYFEDFCQNDRRRHNTEAKLYSMITSTNWMGQYAHRWEYRIRLFASAKKKTGIFGSWVRNNSDDMTFIGTATATPYSNVNGSSRSVTIGQVRRTGWCTTASAEIESGFTLNYSDIVQNPYRRYGISSVEVLSRNHQYGDCIFDHYCAN